MFWQIYSNAIFTLYIFKEGDKNKMTIENTFPNMYCGECPYWLAYNEPDTSIDKEEYDSRYSHRKF